MKKEELLKAFDICCTTAIITILMVHCFITPISSFVITFCIVWLWIGYIMWLFIEIFSLVGTLFMFKNIQDMFNDSNIMKAIESMRDSCKKYKQYKIYKFITTLIFIFMLTTMGHIYLAMFIIFNFILGETLFIKTSELLKRYDALHYINNKQKTKN